MIIQLYAKYHSLIRSGSSLSDLNVNCAKVSKSIKHTAGKGRNFELTYANAYTTAQKY